MLATFGACSLLPSILHADVLVVHTFEGRVSRVDELTGQVISNWEIDTQGALGRISGIAVSDDGVVYLTAFDAGSVLQYSLDDATPVGTSIFAQLPLVGGGLASPGNIKIDSDGLIYVSDTQHENVYRYDPTDAVPTAETFASGLDGVGGLGFDSMGNLLVTDFAEEQFPAPGDQSIYRGGGSPPTVITTAAESTLEGPNAVLVRADDSFLVVDMFSDRIVSFDSDGDYLGEFAQVPFPLDVNPAGPYPPNNLNALNFGSDLVSLPDGNLLLSTLGISSLFQGASKNYGELVVLDNSGQVVDRLVSDQSPIGAITLVEGFVTLPGDYDRNLEVNSDDYALWREFYGRQVTAFSNADGNGDGLIDAADYAVWRNNFGTVAAAVTSAPEPAGLLLIARLLAYVTAHRRVVS